MPEKTWFTKGLRPGIGTGSMVIGYFLSRKRPDLRRDWDLTPPLNSIVEAKIQPEKTWFTKGLRLWLLTPTVCYLHRRVAGKDLIYEGIETRLHMFPIKMLQRHRAGKDLIYEGIETAQYGLYPSPPSFWIRRKRPDLRRDWDFE